MSAHLKKNLPATCRHFLQKFPKKEFQKKKNFQFFFQIFFSIFKNTLYECSFEKKTPPHLLLVDIFCYKNFKKKIFQFFFKKIFFSIFKNTLYE